MSDIRARATDHGTVILAITDGDGRRAHVELPIELAEKLKAQFEAALVTTRVRRANEPSSETPLPQSRTWMEAVEGGELPGAERG